MIDDNVEVPDVKDRKPMVLRDVVLPVTLVVSMLGAAFAGGVFTSDLKNSLDTMEERFDSKIELLATRVESEMTAIRASLVLLTAEVQRYGADRWTGSDMQQFAARTAEIVEPWAQHVADTLAELGVKGVRQLKMPQPLRN
jgi:hypothetical protein